jgi:ribose transport system permease protein
MTSLMKRPRLAEGTAPVLIVLLALLIGLAITGPAYSEPSGYLALLKRAAPLMILAIGQFFVIVSGGFDLSVGALVTAGVVIAARLIDGDESMTAWVILLVLAFGLLVGLVNGLIATKLLVPSFIVTLGMLLVLDGAVFLWTDGAPRGALSTSFRMFGRGSLGEIPWSVLILFAILVAAVLFMRSGTGRALIAVGDNDNAVRLGGVLLGGGRGSVVAAAAGALSLEALFTLLNLLGVAGALESAVQGVIIIAAVAYAAFGTNLRTRRRAPAST